MHILKKTNVPTQQMQALKLKSYELKQIVGGGKKEEAAPLAASSLKP